MDKVLDKDKVSAAMVDLAHEALNKIEAILEESSGNRINPLGFLAYVMLYCSILESLSLQKAAAMLEKVIVKLSERTSRRGCSPYVS